MFDIEDEAGNVGIKDKKLTNKELVNFLRYIKENYVENFSKAFSDITESMNQQNQEISSDSEFYSPKRSVQLYKKLMPEFNALSIE